MQCLCTELRVSLQRETAREKNHSVSLRVLAHNLSAFFFFSFCPQLSALPRPSLYNPLHPALLLLLLRNKQAQSGARVGNICTSGKREIKED